MIIAFWSLFPFIGRKSTNMLLMAQRLAQKRKEQLLVHAHYEGSGPEYLFLSGKNREQLLHRSEFGMESLDHMLRCERYDKSLVVNSSYSFQNGYLHILPSGSEAFCEKTDGNHIGSVLRRASQDFDNVWVEVPAGISDFSVSVCNYANLVIFNLSQNPLELNHLSKFPVFEKELFLIGAYEPRGVYNLHNLQKVYPRLERKCEAVPYFPELLEAQSCGNFEQFLSNGMKKASEYSREAFLLGFERALQMVEKFL